MDQSFFSLDDKHIDVKKIMDELYKDLPNIAEKDAALEYKIKDLKSRGTVTDSIVEMNYQLEKLNQLWNIEIFPRIHSHRAMIGSMIVFAKRVIRKLTKFLIQPPLEQQKDFNSVAVRSLNQIANLIRQYEKDLDQKNQEIRELKTSVQKLEEMIASIPGVQREIPIDYLEFENRYRGSRESVKQKQEKYLQLFQEGATVIDLGCGRGEFLELATEKGIDITGVDLRPDMIVECQKRGFKVVKEDLLQFLKNSPDNTFDGIFLSHVIEHLPPYLLPELIGIAHQKLKKGGYLIAETPNAQSLAIYAQSFYLDPTHSKPIHPLYAQFLFEQFGFETQTWFSGLMGDGTGDYMVPVSELQSQPNLEKFLSKVQNFVFGPLDFAVVGKKR